MSAFIQLYIASFKEFVRDRMAVFWTLAFPLVFIVMFGVLFSFGGDNQFDVGLVVQDEGESAQKIAGILRQVSVFEMSELGYDDELTALKRGDRSAVIVLPVGLSDAVAAKQPARINVLYDPVNQQTSQIVLTITRQVLDQVEREVSGTTPAFVVTEETVQASQLRTIDFLLPGILAMALMQLGLFGTAQPMVALRDQGVLRRLGATPLPRWTVLASQIGMRLTIALAQTIVIVAVGVFVFQVPMQGNALLLLAMVVFGALTFIALGYVVAAFSKNQETAAGISSIINFPMMFLSGLFFPIEFIPAFLQPIVAIIPLTYLVDALRQIMVGTNPVFPLPVDLGVLLAWFSASLVVAIRFFKWE
jgi:ABC-2 type transport system permease protein